MNTMIVTGVPGNWQPIAPESGALADLRVGSINKVAGHPDLAIVVLDETREYVVTRKLCAHEPRDLTVEGSVDCATKTLSCFHKNRKWCLRSGTSNSEAPSIALYPSALINDVLFVQLDTRSVA